MTDAVTTNPNLTSDECRALRDILEYAATQHGKSQHGYFSSGGWVGFTLLRLLERAEKQSIESTPAHQWFILADEMITLLRSRHAPGTFNDLDGPKEIRYLLKWNEEARGTLDKLYALLQAKNVPHAVDTRDWIDNAMQVLDAYTPEALTSNEHVKRVVAAARRAIDGMRLAVGSPLHLLEMFIKIVEERPADETGARRCALPVITVQMLADFGQEGFFEPCDESRGVRGVGWSQAAVDFACLIQGMPPEKAAETTAQFGMDTPWPLPDVLAKLIQATEHLLNVHDCDVHGHEEYRAAANRGNELLKQIMEGSAVKATALCRHKDCKNSPEYGEPYCLEHL